MIHKIWVCEECNFHFKYPPINDAHSKTTILSREERCYGALSIYILQLDLIKEIQEAKDWIKNHDLETGLLPKQIIETVLDNILNSLTQEAKPVQAEPLQAKQGEG